MRTTSVALILFGLAIALGTQAKAQSASVTSPGQPSTVVFVCEHGSVKSLVAMEHFNRKARERGLSYRAVARGTAPDPVVPTPVQNGLRADGFDVSDFVPRMLSTSDVADGALIVSFDSDIAGTVGGRARYVKWDGLPAVLADYPRGRDAIVRQVDALIDALARSGSP